MNIALVVGHRGYKDRGAKSEVVGYEFTYWCQHVGKIVSAKHNLFVHTELEVKELSFALQRQKIDIAIELHFNSFGDQSPIGAEMLYLEGTCLQLPDKLLANFCLFAFQKNRGVKAITTYGRGFRFLSRMETYGMRAMIFEPAFAWEQILHEPERLCESFSKALDLL